MQIELSLGDITQQPDMAVIVNSANQSLMAGSGVCGAIHKAAGPALEAFCLPYAPLALGQAIITPGFLLPNRYVIHVHAPHYLLDAEPEHWLAVAVRQCMHLAERQQLASMVLPAISTGIYKFPLALAATIMIQTARAEAAHLTHLRVMRWVLASQARLDVFQGVLD
jgi:O-acetyl-ADP-ribose deacetylase